MLPIEHTETELRAHAASLRSLARDLLRDRHAADDVMQQTMQQALSQRELRPGPLGGWLHRVLENFARQWQRTERRRVAREARLPAPEAEPSPDEALMRRESLRSVTNAVLQLDEPYQTAVFLRYFEDLPPRAIAKRTGTGVATVKSRLQRGLVMLRQKLDRQHGGERNDWRRALAASFGLPLAVGTGIGVTTGVIMGSTGKVLVAAGVVCAGGLFAWRFLDDPAPVRVEVHEAAPDAGPAIAAADNRSEAHATDREAATETAPVAPWLAHPFVFELEVLVVDPTGLPREGESIELAPFHGETNFAPTSTGPDGRAVVTWRSRVAAGEVVVRDRRGLLHRVPMQHGRRTVVSWCAEDSPAKWMFAVSTKLDTTAELSEQVPVVTGIPIVGNFFHRDEGKPMQPGLHPHAVFATNAAVTLEEKKEEVSLGEGSYILTDSFTGNLRVAFTTSAVEALDPADATANAPAGPSIRGLVFGEDGKPAAKVPVALLGTSPQPLYRAATDDEGRFEFENLTENTFTVRAGGDAGGLGTATAVVTRGATPVQVQLRRETCVRGRLVRSDGQPHAPYRISWHAEDGSSCDETTTADDGSFCFANVPAKPGNVFAWLADDDVPIVFAPHVLVDNGELLLRHEVEAAHGLQLEPVLPDDCRSAAIEVRVWQLDTGLGTLVSRPEKGKPWRLEQLPAGWYQVELRAAGVGFVDLGRHWLDGKGDVDLGRITLPLPGRVTFAIPDTLLPEGKEHRVFEVCELRHDLDVRITLAGARLDHPTLLPGGDYVLAFRHRSGSVRFERFAVRAGEETTVRVTQ